MPVLPAPAAATHQVPGTRFTSLATPSRGTVETAVWRVEIGGVAATATAGDAIAVPPETAFVLSNAGRSTLCLLCCLPVGGQARMGEGEPFTPPWAL